MAELTDQDRAELRNMTETTWVEAGLAQDWEAAMELCSEDLIYMPQDHAALHGRGEAQEFLSDFPQLSEFRQKIVEIFGDTDVAVVRGTFAGTFSVDGQEMTGEGKVLATASKSRESWEFTRICFNWDAPPAPAD